MMGSNGDSSTAQTRMALPHRDRIFEIPGAVSPDGLPYVYLSERTVRVESEATSSAIYIRLTRGAGAPLKLIPRLSSPPFAASRPSPFSTACTSRCASPIAPRA